MIESNPDAAAEEIADQLLSDTAADMTEGRFAGAMARQADVTLDQARDMYAERVADFERDDTEADTESPDESDDDQADDDQADEQSDESEQQAADAELTREGIRQHYDRVADVYAELGTFDGTHFAIGNADNRRWYNRRDAAGEWDGKGRPYALGREFDDLRQQLDRVVYATVNYAPGSYFMDAWTPYAWRQGDDVSGRRWDGGSSPMPDYGDLSAYAPFADIDLADEIKERRPDGDVDRAVIEQAIERYVERFAQLAGDTDHVYALDSVGGAYVMIAPSSTRPIAEHFDGDDRDALLDELTDRLNEWLDAIADDVARAVPDVEGVFEPDTVNNKNRLYKAPLSIHKELDGVVTPIDTESPGYEYTKAACTDDELVDEAMEWAQGFTDDRHAAAAESIVTTLWADEHDTGASWVDTLQEWLDEREQQQQKYNEQREAQNSIEPGDIPDDLESTDDIDVVNAAIENIDVQDLARSLADGWDDTRDPPRFDPSWRTSSSGASCYAYRNKFVDLAEGSSGGGALQLIARDRGIINDLDRDSVSGDDYWRAVNELRKEGYHIPYFEGHDGLHPDVMRLYEDPDDEDDEKRKSMLEVFS